MHIRVPDQPTADALDDLLWTFRDGSFVPHEQIGTSGRAVNSPVTIGRDGVGSHSSDLLINLSERKLEDSNAFARVAEIVTSDDASRQASRERFVEYRNEGHTLNTHKL